MQTPIVDFVKDYAKKEISRFHMPGHKGKPFLGCEKYDITEIHGADSLYEAEGIIAESEKNATELFDTGRTVFSTEGSSQCIRAMMYLAICNQKRKKRPYVIAGRNAHKAFLYAATVLDFDIVWLWPKEMHSLCSCQVLSSELEIELKKQIEPPVAVYITSPDYLGGQLPIDELAELCHQYHTILAVDNAHGAYLHFLEKKEHPIDRGADLCCDSAHKTLPVLTGGAYLQISKTAPEHFLKEAKMAMALFGSTSPSYLILASLDLCNAYLSEHYRERLKDTIEQLERVRRILRKNGWQVEKTDPLKLTVRVPLKLTGDELANRLREAKIECEYADPEYLVFMTTPEHTKKDYERFINAFGKNKWGTVENKVFSPVKCEQVLSVREAIFSEQESVLIEDALGRICATPIVGCPPAIPIVVSGERIEENAIALFDHYGITSVKVVK